MEIGIPKETLNNEYRVGLLPENVAELTKLGLSVYVETEAGSGVGKSDEDYKLAGATIVANAKTLYEKSKLIIKVKEPNLQESSYLSSKHILFAFLHLAAHPEMTKTLLEKQCTAIAYETITDEYGRLPILMPMSEIAGNLAVLLGSKYLLRHNDIGMGKLLGGLEGVSAAKVLILGGGAAGSQAVRTAIGLQAEVTVIDKSLEKLKNLHQRFAPNLKTLYATHSVINQQIKEADLIIGAVLVPGRLTPKLVMRNQLKEMKKGAVLVDISIDQGGCFETSQPTSHNDPSYIIDDVVHVCITNLPGCVSISSTQALNNATLPYILKLAENGLEALLLDKGFRAGLNLHRGQITYSGISQDINFPYVLAEQALRN